eukprot:TRINITY_DN8828_c0_g1_i2.p1 TRINITY_DN8828_c0_g1~~TRINITY_DN8828_c0_g1_i2.p1  ORF type:complete len:3760 (+),score=200.29 TRINITY_DN8828_c0_g1_i2:99-11282(+)
MAAAQQGGFDASSFQWSLGSASKGMPDVPIMGQSDVLLRVKLETGTAPVSDLVADLSASTGQVRVFAAVYPDATCSGDPTHTFSVPSPPFPYCNADKAIDCLETLGGTADYEGMRLKVNYPLAANDIERKVVCFSTDRRDADVPKSGTPWAGIIAKVQPKLQMDKTNQVILALGSDTYNWGPRCEAYCMSGSCYALDAFSKWGLGAGDNFQCATGDVTSTMQTLLFSHQLSVTGGDGFTGLPKGVFYGQFLNECGVGSADDPRSYPYRAIVDSADSSKFSLPLPTHFPERWNGRKFCVGWAIADSGADVAPDLNTWDATMFPVDTGIVLQQLRFKIQLGDRPTGDALFDVRLPSGYNVPFGIYVESTRTFSVALRKSCRSPSSGDGADLQVTPDSVARALVTVPVGTYNSYQLCYIIAGRVNNDAVAMIPAGVTVTWEANAEAIIYNGIATTSGRVTFQSGQDVVLQSQFGAFYHLVSTATTSCNAGMYSTLFTCQNATLCSPSVSQEFKICIEGLTGTTLLSGVTLLIETSFSVAGISAGNVSVAAGIPFSLTSVTSATTDATTKNLAISAHSDRCDGYLVSVRFPITATTMQLESTGLPAGLYRVCYDDGGGSYATTTLYIRVSAIVLEGYLLQGNDRRVKALGDSARVLHLAGFPADLLASGKPTAAFRHPDQDECTKEVPTEVTESGSPFQLEIELESAVVTDLGTTWRLCIDLMGRSGVDGGRNHQKTTLKLDILEIVGEGAALVNGEPTPFALTHRNPDVTALPDNVTFLVHPDDEPERALTTTPFTTTPTGTVGNVLEFSADVESLSLATGTVIIVVLQLPVGPLSTGKINLPFSTEAVEFFATAAGETISVTRIQPVQNWTSGEGGLNGRWLQAVSAEDRTLVGMVSAGKDLFFRIGGAGLGARQDSNGIILPEIAWAKAGTEADCPQQAGGDGLTLSADTSGQISIIKIPRSEQEKYKKSVMCIGWPGSAMVPLNFTFIVAPAPMYFAAPRDGTDVFLTDNFNELQGNEPRLLGLTNTNITLNVVLGYSVASVANYAPVAFDTADFDINVFLSSRDCGGAQHGHGQYLSTYGAVEGFVESIRPDGPSGSATRMLVGNAEVILPLSRHDSEEVYHVCIGVGPVGEPEQLMFLMPTRTSVLIGAPQLNGNEAPRMRVMYSGNIPEMLDKDIVALRGAVPTSFPVSFQMSPIVNAALDGRALTSLWSRVSVALANSDRGERCDSLETDLAPRKLLTVGPAGRMSVNLFDLTTGLGYYDLCMAVVRQLPSSTTQLTHIGTELVADATDIFLTQTYAPTGFRVVVTEVDSFNTYPLTRENDPAAFSNLGLFAIEEITLPMTFGAPGLGSSDDLSTYALGITGEGQDCKTSTSTQWVTASMPEPEFFAGGRTVLQNSRFYSTLSVSAQMAGKSFWVCVRVATRNEKSGADFFHEPVQLPVNSFLTPLPGIEGLTNGTLTTVSSRLRVCARSACPTLAQQGGNVQIRVLTGELFGIEKPCESPDLASQNLRLILAEDDYMLQVPSIAALDGPTSVLCLDYQSKSYFLPIALRALNFSIDGNHAWNVSTLAVPVGASATTNSVFTWQISIGDEEWDFSQQLWFKFMDAPGKCDLPGDPTALQHVSEAPQTAETCTTGGRLQLRSNEYARFATSESLHICIASVTAGSAQPLHSFYGATSLLYRITDAPQSVRLLNQPLWIDRTANGLTFNDALTYEILGSYGDKVSKLPQTIFVSYYLQECPMVGVDECIEECETATPPNYPPFNEEYFDPDNGTFDREYSRVGELSCVALCEEFSMVNCTDDAVNSPLWNTIAYSSDVIDEAKFAFDNETLLTRIQSNLIVRYRHWYRVVTDINMGGEHLEPHISEPVQLAPCYDWRHGHWGDTRSRFNGTRLDTEFYYPGSRFAVPNTSLCEVCPEGALCDGSTEVRVEENYWRANSNSYMFYFCGEPLGSDACTGNTTVGRCETGYVTHYFDNTFEDGMNFKDDNPLCTMCDEGYGRQVGQGLCGKCPDPAVTLTITGVVTVIVVIVLIATVFSTLHTSQKNENNELAVMVRMFLSYISVASLTGNYGTLYADVVKDILGVQKAAGGKVVGEVASLDCIFPGYSYYDRFWLVMTLPGIFAVLLGLVFGPIFRFLRLYYDRRREKRNELRAKTWFGTKFIRDIVIEEPDVVPYEEDNDKPVLEVVQPASDTLEESTGAQEVSEAARAEDEKNENEKNEKSEGGIDAGSSQTHGPSSSSGPQVQEKPGSRAQVHPTNGALGRRNSSRGSGGTPMSGCFFGTQNLLYQSVGDASLEMTGTFPRRDSPLLNATISATMRESGDQRLREIHRELENLFDDVDRNKNGTVTRYELRVSASLCPELSRLIAIHFNDDVAKFLDLITLFKAPPDPEGAVELAKQKSSVRLFARNRGSGLRLRGQKSMRRRQNQVAPALESAADHPVQAQDAPLGNPEAKDISRHHFISFLERYEWKRQTGVDVTAAMVQNTNEGVNEVQKIDAHLDELGAKLGFRTSAMFKAYLASLIIFLVVLYPTVCETAVNFLQCDTLNWGRKEDSELWDTYDDPAKYSFNRYIFRHDRSIDCSSTKFKTHRVFAVICLLIYGVTFPIGTMLACKVLRGKQEVTWAESLEDRTNRRQRLQDSRLLFGFLMVGYTRKMWFWEAVVMLRKLIMVCISVYVEDTLSTYVAMWTMTICCVLQLRYQPYDHKDLNRLEFVSLAIIACTLNMSLLYRPESGGFADHNVSDRQIVGFWVLTVVLMVSNLLLVFYFLFWIVVYLKVMVTDIIMENLQKVNRLGPRLPVAVRCWLMREWAGRVFYARNEDCGERRMLESGAVPLLSSERQNFLGAMRENLRDVYFFRRKEVIPAFEDTNDSDDQNVMPMASALTQAEDPAADVPAAESLDAQLTIGSIVERNPENWDSDPSADGQVDTFAEFEVPSSLALTFESEPLKTYSFDENKGVDVNGMPSWRNTGNTNFLFLNRDGFWVITSELSHTADALYVSEKKARDVMPHRHYRWKSKLGSVDMFNPSSEPVPTKARINAPADGEYGTVVGMELVKGGGIMVRVLWSATPEKAFNPNKTHLHQINAIQPVITEKGVWKTLLYTDILRKSVAKVTAYGRMRAAYASPAEKKAGKGSLIRVRAVVKSVPKMLREDDPSKIGKVIYAESCLLGWPYDLMVSGDQRGPLRQAFGSVQHSPLGACEWDETDRVARGMTHHYEASDELLSIAGPQTAVMFQYWHPADDKPQFMVEPLQYSYQRQGYAGMLRTINATEPGFQICVKMSKNIESRAAERDGPHGVTYDDDLLDLMDQDDHDKDDDPDDVMLEREEAWKHIKSLEERVARQKLELELLKNEKAALEDFKMAAEDGPDVGLVQTNLDNMRDEKEKLAGMYTRLAEELVFLKHDRGDLTNRLDAQAKEQRDQYEKMQKNVKRTFAMAQKAEESLKETQQELNNEIESHRALKTKVQEALEKQGQSSELATRIQGLLHDKTPSISRQPSHAADVIKEIETERIAFDEKDRLTSQLFTERLEMNRLRNELDKVKLTQRASSLAQRTRNRISQPTPVVHEIDRFIEEREHDIARLTAALESCMDTDSVGNAEQLQSALTKTKQEKDLLDRMRATSPMSPAIAMPNHYVSDDMRLDAAISESKMLLDTVLNSPTSPGAELSESRPGTSSRKTQAAGAAFLTPSEKRQLARVILEREHGSSRLLEHKRPTTAEGLRNRRPPSVR